jgi:hypothetical protein
MIVRREIRLKIRVADSTRFLERDNEIVEREVTVLSRISHGDLTSTRCG